MAEVVSVMERNYSGAEIDNYDLTNKVGRYCTDDNPNPGTTNPCKVPTADFYYSFWKSLYLDVSGTGWTSIRDIYWYCDGNVADNWNLDDLNGGGLFIGKRDTGDNGCPQASYAVATGVVGTSGNAIGHVSDGHPYYRAQITPTRNADLCLADNPLLIDSGVYTAAFLSNFWVTQIKIPPTAGHGECAAKTFNLSYTVY